MFFIFSLFDLWKRVAVVRVAAGKGVACNSHICYKMEHFLITVFLMSNESSRSEAVRVQRDSLVSSLYSPIFKTKDSSLQSYSLYVVWISGPGLPAFEDCKEKTRAGTPFSWFWPLGAGYSIAGRENSGNRILIIFVPRNLHFWTKILLTHTGC